MNEQWINDWINDYDGAPCLKENQGRNNKSNNMSETLEQIPIVVREHHMKLEADPLRLKIIAEALGEYIGKHCQLADDTTLRDFAFNMEAEYQRWYELDEDDWGYTEEHKEELAIHD